MRRAYWAIVHRFADALHLATFRLKSRAALRLYEMEMEAEEALRDAA